jgi:hypothetical protein
MGAGEAVEGETTEEALGEAAEAVAGEAAVEGAAGLVELGFKHAVISAMDQRRAGSIRKE